MIMIKECTIRASWDGKLLNMCRSNEAKTCIKVIGCSIWDFFLFSWMEKEIVYGYRNLGLRAHYVWWECARIEFHDQRYSFLFCSLDHNIFYRWYFIWYAGYLIYRRHELKGFDNWKIFIAFENNKNFLSSLWFFWRFGILRANILDVIWWNRGNCWISWNFQSCMATENFCC